MTAGSLRMAIGINCDVTVDRREDVKLPTAYADAVVRAGGLPYLLPPLTDPDRVDELLDPVDGLVFSGCDDYDASLWGGENHPACILVPPRKQAADEVLARAALQRKIPILGICGGMQLLNVVLGGSLIAHLPDGEGAFLHRGAEGNRTTVTHEVRPEPGTHLAEVLGATRVVSSHHQAVDRLGDGLAVTARAPDGVIEGFESIGESFVLGVQWHPEQDLEKAETFRLFRLLVDRAGKYRLE